MRVSCLSESRHRTPCREALRSVPAVVTSGSAVPVLVDGARTPIGRLGRALGDIPSVQLGELAVRGALARSSGIVPEYALLGSVLQAGNGQNPARQAALRGGCPPTTPATTLNDVCLASLSAVTMAGVLVGTKRYRSVLVGGFDSMSRAPHVTWMRSPRPMGDHQLVDSMVHDGLWCSIEDSGMGVLSDAENQRLGISREQQDEFALASHQRAAGAAERLAQETIEVDLGNGVMRADEGVRSTSTLDQLAALQPAFTSGGTITAGNASQLSDAGAAGIVADPALVEAAGGKPLAEIVDYEVVAGPDGSLHMKPAWAAQALLKRHGMSPRHVDLWEINEAFAGVVVASMRELEIDHERVNVNGGAIALGHPLGASGFRLVLTLAYEMRRRGVEFGVAAICGGGGQGEAVLLKAPS